MCGCPKGLFVAGAGFERHPLAEASPGTVPRDSSGRGREAEASEDARHEIETEQGSTEMSIPGGGPTANIGATSGL
jgi:hypothetical protein